MVKRAFKKIVHPSQHDIHPVTYDSGIPGNNVLITGVVHGTEPCGKYGTERAVSDIEQGRLSLVSGSVTFIPVCNPEAYRQGKREIDKSLNSDFISFDPDTYEGRIVNYLRPFFINKRAFADLHSHGSKGEAFLSLGNNNKAELDWAQAIGTPCVVYNFIGAFDKTINMNNTTTHKISPPTTSVAFARSLGIAAITVECGQNKAPEADAFAYFTALKTLQHWGVISLPEESPALINPITGKTGINNEQKIIRLIDGCQSQGADNLSLTHGLVNFAATHKGENVAQFRDGSVEYAPRDGYVVLPFNHEKALRPAGKPWFFYGIEETREEYLQDAGSLNPS